MSHEPFPCCLTPSITRGPSGAALASFRKHRDAKDRRVDAVVRVCEKISDTGDLAVRYLSCDAASGDSPEVSDAREFSERAVAPPLGGCRSAGARLRGRVTG